MGRFAAAMAAAELGLPPDAADGLFEQAEFEGIGIDFDNFGAQRGNEKIIEAHNKSLRHTLQILDQSGAVVSTSSSWDTKPVEEFPTPPPYAALMPIACADMQPQTTHRWGHCSAV
jgi:hypothetical protein